MSPSPPTEVVFLGGRAGVGKTRVAAEMSYLLSGADVSHAVIEGDTLDQAHPAPWRNSIPLAERNLAAMWGNYREIGYHRLIYTNTVSVLEIASLTEALGGEVASIAVLLTALDSTATRRLASRETGSELDIHLRRSSDAAIKLDRTAGADVHRIATDGLTVTDVAEAVLALTSWMPGVVPTHVT